eukprot:SAG11_NODE_1516_length_4766_cov_1.916006_3_plen_50_part_00
MYAQEGFGLMTNVAIDQHLLRRNRQFDLLQVLQKQPKIMDSYLPLSTQS